MIFGECQNHQNYTFKGPYHPKTSCSKNRCYAKINTILLLYLYQIFIFLLGHHHFFCIFSSRLWRTFLRNTLYNKHHPSRFGFLKKKISNHVMMFLCEGCHEYYLAQILMRCEILGDVEFPV